MTPYVPLQVLMMLVGSCLPRNSSRTNQSHRWSMPSFSMLNELLSLPIILLISHYRKKLPCCHLLTRDGYGMTDWNPGCLIGAICLKSARHVLYWLAAINDASTESVGVQEMLQSALLLGPAKIYVSTVKSRMTIICLFKDYEIWWLQCM